MHTESGTAEAAGRPRDLRLDFFRGVALLCIFIDHIPDNALAKLTLTNFGFADAAEVFVALAGYACFLAYATPRPRMHLRGGFKKLGERIGLIYLAHVAVLVVGALALLAAAHVFGNPFILEHVNLVPLKENPLGALARAAVLFYQPGYLNILPLYLVLLLWLPMLLWLIRKSVGIAFLVSAAIWVAAGILRYNLPNWTDASGWVFDPFAWQFLFSLGAIAASLSGRDMVSRSLAHPLFWLASCYLAFAFVVAAPWTRIWGLEEARILPDFRPQLSKQYLSAWRVAHIVALAYVVASAVPAGAAWLRSRWARWLVNCGQHSLPVFCAGILLSLAGFIVVAQFGTGWRVQLTVNFVGALLLGVLGCWLAQPRQSKGDPQTVAIPRA